MKRTFFFLNSFGSSICGYSRFNKSKKGQKLFSGANWKTWVDRALDVHTSDKNEKILALAESVIQQETVAVLSAYASNKINKKFQGWNADAMSEYNELFQKVQDARKCSTRKEFEKEYLHGKCHPYDNAQESTSLSASYAEASFVPPCNELSIVVVSDSSIRSTDHFSDVSTTQGL